MRSMLLKAALLSSMLIAAPVLAQDATVTATAAAPVKVGDAIYSSDGWRIGRVDRVATAKDGTPNSAWIIFRGKMVRVPLSTVAKGEKGLTSSLTVADINK